MTKRLVFSAIILLVFGGYLKVFPFSQQEVPPNKPLSQLPLVLDDWTGRDLPVDSWALDMLQVSDYLQREYRRGKERILVYVGYYASQTGGAEIHSPTHCLPGSGWIELESKKKSLTLHNGKHLKFMEAVYQNEGGKDVFIYWYQVGQNYATNKYSLKLLTMIGALERRRTNAVFIRFSSPLQDDKNLSIERLKAFMEDFMPLLDQFLPV